MEPRGSVSIVNLLHGNWYDVAKFIEIQYPPFRELINVRNIEIIENPDDLT